MSTTRKTHRKRQNLQIKILTISLPFLILAFIEVALHHFHAGYRTELFVQYPSNTNYLVFNRQASKKYFTDPSAAPTGNAEIFLKQKKENSFRIFVLGESTTLGYPYFHNGSFHRMLLFRLMNEHPNLRIEIINLSLTAVNSYTVKGFAKEIIKQKPDAVLIYSGQNEYYGAMGTASAQGISGSPALVNTIIKAREFKTIQLLTMAYAKLTRHNPKENSKTRMEIMAGDKLIPRQSKLFDRGIAQYRYNIDRALNYLSKENIPVFISNLTSNIKDLPPLSGDQLSDEAKHHYSTADSLYHRGEYEQAYQHYILAKDTDPLRFRAPEELNEIIPEICRKYKNTHFVDTKTAFEQSSPHSIPGDDLFTDHVHPNRKGYAIMAEAFHRKIIESQILPPSTSTMTDDEYITQMPLSPIDSIAAHYRIMQLKAHWPFNDPEYDHPVTENTVEEKLAGRLFRREEDWLAVHNTLYLAYTGMKKYNEAAIIAEGAALEYAEDAAFHEKAALANAEAGNYHKAVFYMRQSLNLSPTVERARYLSIFHLSLDEPDIALQYLQYAIENNRTGTNFKSVLPAINRLISLRMSLKMVGENTTVMKQIASIYLQLSNREAAMKYIDRVLALKPGDDEALAMKNEQKEAP